MYIFYVYFFRCADIFFTCRKITNVIYIIHNVIVRCNCVFADTFFEVSFTKLFHLERTWYSNANVISYHSKITNKNFMWVSARFNTMFIMYISLKNVDTQFHLVCVFKEFNFRLGKIMVTKQFIPISIQWITQFQEVTLNYKKHLFLFREIEFPGRDRISLSFYVVLAMIETKGWSFILSIYWI